MIIQDMGRVATLFEEVLHAEKNVASMEERPVGKQLSRVDINRNYNLGKYKKYIEKCWFYFLYIFSIFFLYFFYVKNEHHKTHTTQRRHIRVA